MSSRWVRAARASLGLALGALLALVVLEGVSSTLLLAHELYTLVRRPGAERVHTQYDPELGWAHLPNLQVPNMYGPGIGLRTNARGFRGRREVEPVAPADRRRVVCSGDSFTLGHGVDDDHTWCELLAAGDARLETVNLGQGGYGLDQAYLWYRRDGAGLRPSVHLFAFVRIDFERMATPVFGGIPKPVLAVRDGVLVAENTPVPQRTWQSRLRFRALSLLRELRSYQLVETVLGLRLAAAGAAAQAPGETQAVAARVFESLRDLNQAQGTALVLVFLPMLSDHRGIEADRLRAFVRDEAQRLGIAYVDLVTGFKELADQEAEALFFREDAMGYAGTEGHYTVRGNEYVARRLRDELAAILAGSRPPEPAPAGSERP